MKISHAALAVVVPVYCIASVGFAKGKHHHHHQQHQHQQQHHHQQQQHEHQEAEGQGHGEALPANPGDPSSPVVPEVGSAESEDLALSVRAFSKLNHINRMEIHMGKLGEKLAAKSEVQDFTKKMIADHSANEKDLLELAKQKSVRIVSMSRSRHAEDRKEFDQEKRDMAKLHSLSGVNFDKEYMTQMVEGHKKTLAFLTSVKDTLPSSDERVFIENTAKAVQEHYELALKISKNL